MSEQFPKYYLHRDGFENGTAYIVRTSSKDATAVKCEGDNINFTWRDLDDRLVVNKVLREITAEESHRELERLLEMYDSSPSHTVVVHGLQMKIGDYYYGLTPKVVGLWAVWDDDPTGMKTPDGMVCISEVESLDSSGKVQQFWMYCGPVPKIGQCVKHPPVLEPDKKYRMAGMVGTPWIYKFSAEGYSSDIGKRTMLHWFVSSTGDEVVSFTRARIGDKVED